MPACAVCGFENGPDGIPRILPDPAGPPDFDTRPSEPARSSVDSWVFKCTSCGYCSGDLTVAGDRAAATVSTDGYKALLTDASLPEKARQFMCWAYILDKEREFADAGWSALHAAWVCDDAGLVDGASVCRGHAIELWRRGKTMGQLFCDNMASEFALVTDVYRRTGEWEHARVACAEGLDLEDLPPPIEAMLRRQLVLIQQRDASTHSMRELLHQVSVG